MTDTIQITPDIVRTLYKSLLNRDPESSLVIDEKLRQFTSLDDLIKSIKACPEYRNAASDTYYETVLK